MAATSTDYFHRDTLASSFSVFATGMGVFLHIIRFFTTIVTEGVYVYRVSLLIEVGIVVQREDIMLLM